MSQLSQINKDLRLLNEVLFSISLIERGLCDIKHSNVDIYDCPIPFLLLSNGFERLMKCIICLRHKYLYKEYPSIKFIKEFKHDISKLLDWIIEEIKKSGYDKKSVATKEDIEFLVNDAYLQRVVQLLSAYGMGARYYNLDIVTEGKSSYQSPENLLNELEIE